MTRLCRPKCNRTMPRAPTDCLGPGPSVLLCCVRVDFTYDGEACYFQEVYACGIRYCDFCEGVSRYPWDPPAEPPNWNTNLAWSGTCYEPTIADPPSYPEENCDATIPGSVASYYNSFSVPSGLQRDWRIYWLVNNLSGFASSGKSADQDANVLTNVPESIVGYWAVFPEVAPNPARGMRVAWNYNCKTGLVDFELRGDFAEVFNPGIGQIRASASVTPDWYLTSAELTAIDPLISDVVVSVNCIDCDNCDPQPCESLDCFPSCISNTQDCDGVTAYHTILFGLVEWSGGAETINIIHDGANWLAEIDLGGDCGVMSISIGCSGGVDQLLTWVVRIAGVPTYGGSELLTLACVDGEVEAEINITYGASCAVTLTLFSNNAGLIP
jgi:hypothetical protein